jgi:hypothetical protein
MKAVLIVIAVLIGMKIVIPRIRQFADPDPSVYGHPRL